MILRSSKSRRIIRSNTLPWNRIEFRRLAPCCAAAVLLASIFMPWAGADEMPKNAVKLKPRSSVQLTSAEQPAPEKTGGGQKPAADRWQELKSRYAFEEQSPASSAEPRRTLSRPQPVTTVHPIPDADDEVSQEPGWASDEVSEEPPLSSEPLIARPNELARDPLPITGFEEGPDWIVGVHPDLLQGEDEDADSQVQAAGQLRPLRPRRVSQPTGEEPEVAEPKGPSDTDTGYTPPGGTGSRKPRQIGDISPRYDMTIDKDIRDFAKEQAQQYGLEFGKGVYQPRAFQGTLYQWEPSNFYHYPLYFEDPQLERYGHTYGEVIQPAVSIARFGGQLLLLPYQMTLDPICTPKYTLGWYRPGDCAPKLHYQVPLNATAAAVEALFVTGFFLAIP